MPKVTKPRAILYLRQSIAREESISLELQETSGRAYCEQQGYTVVGVEADPGISGRTWKRPAVVRVLAAIEAHEADVIVLWKWSRLSRSRLDWAVAADRVETAGGRIESATEQLDTTTSTGRFARGMLTEFAAYESERMGDVWKEAQARRVRNGQPANGKPRFGYLYTREDGFHIDALSGPVLAETYQRYIGGESVYSLVQWLNAGQTRPVRGYGVITDGLWSDRTLRRVMDSGFAAGFIRSGKTLLPGVHPPLIDSATWDAFREARERRRTYRRVERSQYLLSGLVRCICGSSMTAGQFGAQRTPKYRCKGAHEKRTHAGGYIMASYVEAAVYAWLLEQDAELTARAGVLLKTQKAPRATASEHDRLVRRIDTVDAKIDALGMRLIDSGMPLESYQRVLATLTEQRSALEAARLTASVRSTRSAPSIIPQALAAWDRLTVEERRGILRELVDHVEVTPGRPRGIVVVHGRTD